MPQEQKASPANDRRQQTLERFVPELKTHADLLDALEKALDYRGDVTLNLKDGTKTTGYIFNLIGDVADPYLEYYPRNEDVIKSIKYSAIAGMEFSNVDPAAGRSWENWIKKNEDKKKALAEGRDIGNIEPTNMPLED